MPTSDILTRVAALTMMFSAVWNGLMSMFWFFSLILILIGALWLVPMVLAFVTFCLAIVFMVTGHNKLVAAGPLLSMVVSACNLNIIGLAIDTVSLGLIIGSYVARSSEDQAVGFATA